MTPAYGQADVFPVLSAHGETLEWTSAGSEDVYKIVARTDPGKTRWIVVGTRFTPPPVPGTTVSYVVKAAFGESAWSNPVSIDYASGTEPEPPDEEPEPPEEESEPPPEDTEPPAISTSPMGPATPGGGWSVAYADAFALPIGTGPSHDNTWYPNRPTGAAADGNPHADVEGFNSNEMEVFNASQVRVDAEGLELTAKYLSPGHYLSGTVGGPWRAIPGYRPFSFSPGHGETWAFECVCRFPPNTGEADVGFWTDGPPWTDEIDFFEAFGWNGWYSGSGWSNTRTGVGWNGLDGWSTVEGPLSVDPSTAFHRYTTVLYPDDTYSLYVDGVLQPWADRSGPATPDPSSNLPLILSYGLRTPENHASGFTSGSRRFTVRSVAVYEDGQHAGQDITNSGLAPGTTLAPVAPPPTE